MKTIQERLRSPRLGPAPFPDKVIAVYDPLNLEAATLIDKLVEALDDLQHCAEALVCEIGILERILSNGQINLIGLGSLDPDIASAQNSANRAREALKAAGVE